MLTPKIPVAKEGYPFIAVAALPALIAALLGCRWTALVFTLVTLFVVYFFRDPERVVLVDDGKTILSPADGRVIGVEQFDQCPFVSGKTIRISVFMNVFNVHVNRAACAGSVEKVVYKPGMFFAADDKKAALENESCATVLRLASGQKVVMTQIAGLIARRIVCWLQSGDEVTAGQRFGLIRFGSRVDVYVPADSHVTVFPGRGKVKAGQTALAVLA
ncbi:MAG: phosphatidylserine decarboxylase family protein [Desulfobulbaceae bacterium]|jgi:phosphatidylserine decarboxylase|nr:phosphatidylserine decarboxylase family protein [Desulfobulbaceae bacterium]